MLLIDLIKYYELTIKYFLLRCSLQLPVFGRGADETILWQDGVPGESEAQEVGLGSAAESEDRSVSVTLR